MKTPIFTVRRINLMVVPVVGFLLFHPVSGFAKDAFFAHPRTISLLDENNARQIIGDIRYSLTPLGKHHFTLNMHYEKFDDYFLSMKEMKCLAGRELWCHIPYPYASPKTVDAEDMRWLEHRLLFMFKDSQSFGANLWNGIYYTLEWQDNRLVGQANYVNLNKLGVPPEDLFTAPLGHHDLDRVEPGKRWLPRLIIE